MARTRLIKPSFFKNERLFDLGYPSMVLFAGLWTIADRDGRLEDRPKRIKAELFPYEENLKIEALLEGLFHAGFIQRYKSNSHSFIQITKFAKHQQPHWREQASLIPAPGSALGSALGSAQGQAQARPQVEPVLNPSILNPSILNPSILNLEPQADPVSPLAFDTTEVMSEEIETPSPFDEFWRLFIATGKSLNERDREKALREFLKYEATDQERIVAWVRREIRRTWRDIEHTPFPVNALKTEGWTRQAKPRTVRPQSKEHLEAERLLMEDLARTTTCQKS